jgi:hypothetical protein
MGAKIITRSQTRNAVCGNGHQNMVDSMRPHCGSYAGGRKETKSKTRCRGIQIQKEEEVVCLQIHTLAFELGIRCALVHEKLTRCWLEVFQSMARN